MRKNTFLRFCMLLLVLAGCSPNQVSVEDEPVSLATPVSTTIMPTFTVDHEPVVIEPTSAIVSRPAITPSASPTAVLLEEYYIWGIQGHKQYFSLGCEAGVAVDWAAFLGVQINEFEFQTRLPLSDNPDLGFVGSVDGPWGQVPPYAYGVHAAPVAALLQEYGVNAVGLKGYTLEQLKEQISRDRPVIAWVIGNVVGGVPYEYTDSQGTTTVVAAYEHVIIVTGYSQEKIRYNNNGKYYEVPVDVFENSWAVLGNMVVVLAEG